MNWRKLKLSHIFSMDRWIYPRCGSTFFIVSPFNVITRCNTPWVDGCCGPILMIISPNTSGSPTPGCFNISVSRYIITLSYLPGLQNLFASGFFLPTHPVISIIVDPDDSKSLHQTFHTLHVH